MTTTQTTRPQTPTVDQDDSTDASTPPEPGEATREAEREFDALTLDLVFEALKNSRRRQVLQYLHDHGGTASVSELAEHVAALENDTTVARLSSQQRKRVYVGLYQCHLPKLDDMDVVAYDDDRGTVALGPNADQLTRYVDVATDVGDDDPRAWHRYYLGLAGVGTLLLVAVGLAGAAGSMATGAGLGVTVSVVLLALLHGQESS